VKQRSNSCGETAASLMTIAEPEATSVSAKGTPCDSPRRRPGNIRNEYPRPQRGERIGAPHHALSGISGLSLPVSWGDAPGFHIVPRCGKPLPTRQPWRRNKNRINKRPKRHNFCAAKAGAIKPGKIQNGDLRSNTSPAKLVSRRKTRVCAVPAHAAALVRRALRTARPESHRRA
jgi:hypothetical protein